MHAPWRGDHAALAEILEGIRRSARRHGEASHLLERAHEQPQRRNVSRALVSVLVSALVSALVSVLGPLLGPLSTALLFVLNMALGILAVRRSVGDAHA